MSQDSLQLAELFFGIFVFIADCENNLTPKEVDHFNRLVAKPNWVADPQVRAAVQSLQREYGPMWTNYARGDMKVGIEEIASRLEAVEDAESLKRKGATRDAMRVFVARLRISGAEKSRAGAGSESGRLRTRRQIEHLLNMRGTKPDKASFETKKPPRKIEPSYSGVEDPDRWSLPLLSDRNLANWKAGKIRVRCIGVIQECADVKTYSFAAIEPCLFSYLPGQNVLLELPIEGRVLRRSYTISSSPSRPYAIAITVKRVPMGWVSNWLYENMHVGFTLDMNGPNGDFSFLNFQSEKILLLSGGSGVTPMMSMARYIADIGAKVDIAFVNSVRSSEDIIYARELEWISLQMGSAFKIRILPSAIKPGQTWNGLTGRIGRNVLNALVDDVTEREIFLCGPPGFLETCNVILEECGVRPDRIHVESFGTAVVKAGSAIAVSANQVPANVVGRDVAASTPEKVQASSAIELVKIGKTVSGLDTDYILDIAEMSGIELPNSCRSGVCGACKVQKITGDVVMCEQRVLNADELSNGFILTCISQARGHVVLDI